MIRAAPLSNRQAVETLFESAALLTGGLEQTELLLVEENGTIAGTVGFEPYGNVALPRSPAIVPQRRGTGLAQALLVAMLKRLRAQGVPAVYGLSTTIPALLHKLGFSEIGRNVLPKALADSAQLQGLQACPNTARVFHIPVT